MKLKFLTATVLVSIVLLPSATFAEIPSEKHFLAVGKFNENDPSEISEYVDFSSIHKKGKHLYYTSWAIWKHLQTSIDGRQWQYTKTSMGVDCQNWKYRRFKFSSIDRNGRILDTFGDSAQVQTPEPDGILDREINVVCKNK